MQGAEKLEAYLVKYKANREKVPLKILKTKYKAAYGKLTAEIKAEAEAYLKPIAARLPGWLAGCRVSGQGVTEIAEAFGRIYQAGGYAARLGTALYKHYSLAEAEALAREANGKFVAELEAVFHSKTCLYTTAENWDPENPVPPRIYNALIDAFYDDKTRAWIRSDRPEDEKAVLIFIHDKNAGTEERA